MAVTALLGRYKQNWGLADPQHPQIHSVCCEAVERDVTLSRIWAFGLPLRAVFSLSSNPSPKGFSLCLCISHQAVNVTLSLLAAHGGGCPGAWPCCMTQVASRRKWKVLYTTSALYRLLWRVICGFNWLQGLWGGSKTAVPTRLLGDPGAWERSGRLLYLTCQRTFHKG